MFLSMQHQHFVHTALPTHLLRLPLFLKCAARRLGAARQPLQAALGVGSKARELCVFLKVCVCVCGCVGG